MLVNLKELLSEAVKSDFVVPCISIHGEVDCRAIIKAAEYIQGPVVIAVGPEVSEGIGLEKAAVMIRALADAIEVPVCAHLDYGFDKDAIVAAIGYGFGSVSVDAAHLSFEDNILKTREIVKIASVRGVSVEATVASLDIYEAEAFVRDTGIDALRVPETGDFEQVAKLFERIPVPLVTRDIGNSRESLASGLFRKLNMTQVVSKKYARELQTGIENAETKSWCHTFVLSAVPVVEESAGRLLRQFYKPETLIRNEDYQTIWSFPSRA